MAAAYTATNWTITQLESGMVRNRTSPKKTATYKLVLDSGGAVPAAGVPLPRTRMGFVKRPQYILINDIDASYTTATARAIHWVINATAETARAFRYQMASSVATGAGSKLGGRLLRPMPTTVTVDTTHTIYVTCNGW